MSSLGKDLKVFYCITIVSGDKPKMPVKAHIRQARFEQKSQNQLCPRCEQNTVDNELGICNQCIQEKEKQDWV